MAWGRTMADRPYSVRKILVIDDSATIRRAVARELEPLGATVIEAASGEEGIHKAREHSPDLITLDIQMPTANGYDVCEELNLYEETIGIPVVMISSKPSDQERLRALASGAAEYFVKPFAQGDLRTFVVDLLARLTTNRNKVIYAVDGNRAVRAMLDRFLSANGFEAHVFDQASEAFEKMREHPCDLLLLDLNLPSFQAYDLLNQIRRKPLYDALPIIALTASGSRKDLVTAFRSGANEFVRKPFFCEELLIRIESQLKLKALKEHLQHEAMIDPLTKLYNRRQVERLYRAEVARALREHAPLGGLIIDVDHFKRFNDTYGHSVGDEMLVGISQAIQRCVRATDVVGRFGGEEFVVLLPRAPIDGLRVVAERLRNGIRNTTIKTSVGDMRASVSVGGISWDDKTLGPSTPLDRFLAPADEALYESKRNGRDRVTLAGDSGILKVANA